MKKKKTAFWDHPNNPILLGVRLKEHNIVLQDLARRLVHPTKRRQLCVSYLRGVVRKGIAPSGWREADFRAAVEGDPAGNGGACRGDMGPLGRGLLSGAPAGREEEKTGLG